MKKIAFCLILIISFGCIFTNAFANTTVSLTSATVSQTTGVVTIQGTVSEPSLYQRYTAVALKYKESGEYTISDAVYIGTKETEDITLNGGKFTFTFDGNFQDGEKYIVKIGGSNIDEPQSKELTEGEGGGISPDKFILGDVDGDGTIKFEDASILLQFILDEKSVPKEITESENFFERSNVTGAKQLTANQVVSILQKALDESFVFYAESKTK